MSARIQRMRARLRLFEKAFGLTKELDGLKPEDLCFEALATFVQQREQVYQEIMRLDQAEKEAAEESLSAAQKRELESQRQVLEKMVHEIQVLDRRILPRFGIVEKQMTQKMCDLKKARKLVERYQMNGDWHRSVIVDGDA
jgi:hypothetical protein